MRARALAAQRGQPAPAGHQRRGGVGVGEDRLGRGRSAAGAASWREERLGQRVHPLEPRRAASAAKARRVGAPQKSTSRASPLGGGGQAVGLGVVEHLQPVLERAVRDIGRGQRVGRAPARPSPWRRARRAPRRVRRWRRPGSRPPTISWRVWVKNSISRMPPWPSLRSWPGHLQRPGEPLVRADAQAHVVRVLDRGEVEVPAPDEGAQPLEERLAGGDRAGAGPRLDEGGALPGAPEALVVVLGRLGGDADRGHRRVGAQAQVGAEDVALVGDLGEQLDQRAG